MLGWTSALDENSAADGDAQKSDCGVMGNSWDGDLRVSLSSCLACDLWQVPQPL